jgi:hypothetical protein
MSRFWTVFCVALASLTIAVSGFADPPSHAPAHGHRAKQKSHSPTYTAAPSGFQFVFDSERGFSVAVGLPGIFFHDGHYYRQHNGAWQISVRSNGGWSGVKASKMPAAIHKAHGHPGPAKLKLKQNNHHKKKKGKKR